MTEFETPIPAETLPFQVTTKEEYGAIKYYIATEGRDPKNYLRADLMLHSREFRIEYFKAEIPNQGMGKRLLRAALEEAQKTSATCVKATIVTRESLVAMQRVFGEDAISVRKLGDFGGNNTRAYLAYPLKPSR